MIRSSTGLDNDVADRSPLVTVSNLSLSSPVSTIAAVGFHQSGSADALPMDATENVTTQPITMPSRGRGTHRRTALDVATDVEAAILAPVSGIVVRADSYTLYCCYPDSLVVIMPDVDPELEVRILHLGQLSVSAGDRVEVGDQIAAHATSFPFRSQIDDLLGDRARPHVHIEVVRSSETVSPG